MIGRNPEEARNNFPESILEVIKGQQEAIDENTKSVVRLRLAVARLAIDPGHSLSAGSIMDMSEVPESTFYRILGQLKTAGGLAVDVLSRSYFEPRHQALRDVALYLAIDSARTTPTRPENAIRNWSELYADIANPGAASEAIASITAFSGQQDTTPLYEGSVSVINDSVQIMALAGGQVIDERVGQKVFTLASAVDNEQFGRDSVSRYTADAILTEVEK